MVRSDQATRDSWDLIIEYYDQFSRKHGWEDLAPFRLFINSLANTNIAKKLFASYSHQNLVISTVEGYKDRLDNACVVVIPSIPAGQVEIVEIEGGRNPKETRQTCDLDNAWECLEPVLRRLVGETPPTNES